VQLETGKCFFLCEPCGLCERQLYFVFSFFLPVVFPVRDPLLFFIHPTRNGPEIGRADGWFVGRIIFRQNVDVRLFPTAEFQVPALWKPPSIGSDYDAGVEVGV
jgi:hypothetical protein